MTKFNKVIKWCPIEIIIILILLFLNNNFLKNEDQKITITGDGVGYYDYLPSLFIYHDFPSKNCNSSDEFSERINNLNFYLDYKGHKLNKYPCGTAVFLSPFFYYAHLMANLHGFDKNGFSKPFQKSVFYAAIFYLFLALIFLRKFLSLFNLSWFNIAFIQVLAVFSTSLLNYTIYEPSFSHVYSFFAITTFMFLTKYFFLYKKPKYFLWACFLLGLVIILRQVNCLIILFIPFLAGSYKNLKDGIFIIFKKKSNLIIGFLIIISIISIQLLLWHYQTGKFFIYSYQGESFNFLNPAFFNILISYRKGLFVYAPITFISLFGCYIFIKNKHFYLFITWLIFFIILTYILSSWHSWEYGCSYGLRAYIDFYAIFFILLAIFIESINIWIKLFVIVISILTIPLDIIQTKQYKEYILHSYIMDEQKYWTVFLRLDDRFKGLVWKRTYTFNSQTTKNIFTKIIPDTRIEPNVNKQLFFEYSNNIKGFDRTNIIQVSFDNEFCSEQDERVELTINDSLNNKCYYYHNPPLIHFEENGLNKFQQGVYNYELESINKDNNKKICLKIFSKDKEVILKNIKIKFLEYHI
ncbi:MAG TPA: hypothetical protein PKK00_05980 [Bacteroidales bacterium]|nr:hypothetical protein [Bacteroidales bacterium]HPS16820.1 hypothetical protein [Bacteroidales bacterium]